MRKLLIIGLLMLLCLPAHAWELVSCHDGDTCDFRQGRKKVKVRLQSIDAPELNQPYGKSAKRWIENRLKGKDVQLQCSGRSWSRKTCGVLANGKDVQLAMLKAGWAWVYPRYNRGGVDYLLAGAKAKEAKRGLWQGNPIVSPYCYRHMYSWRCRLSAKHMPSF